MIADALRTGWQALERYGMHEKGCPARNTDNACSCGLSAAIAVLATLQVVQEPPQKFVCNALAPDRSSRTCDKPQGHDGDHWTYGGDCLAWSAEARAPHPERTEPVDLRQGCGCRCCDHSEGSDCACACHATGECADRSPAKSIAAARVPHEPPADTYTPLMWVTMAADQQYEEYIRVRQLAQASRAVPPLDTRFRDAFRLLYTDVEDFVNHGSLGSTAGDLARHRLKQFGKLFNEAMRPDLPAAVPQAAQE